MKKIILYPAIVLMGMSAFTACKKSSSSSASSKNMTATVNGKSETTSNVIAVKATMSGVTEMELTGTFSDGHQLLITVFGFNGNGSYTFNTTSTGGTSDAFWITTGTTSTLANTSNTGSMTVTSSSSSGLSGSFSFVTNDSTTVSGGSFSATY